MSHMFGSDYDELIDRARLGSAYDNQLSDIAEERLEIPNEKRGKGEKPVMLVTELEADAYRERPPRPICKFDEIQWAEPKQLEDETTVGIKFCWPLAFEAQMWEQARCRECNQLARWIGIAKSIWRWRAVFHGGRCLVLLVFSTRKFHSRRTAACPPC